MALDARDRSEIYQKLVLPLGEHHANVLMSQFPSVEADELVTRQFLRAELADVRSEFADVRSEMKAGFAEVRSEMNAGFAEVRSEMHAGFADVRSEMHAGLGDVRSEMHAGLGALRIDMHRQTVWLGTALAGSTALLATLGLFT